MINGALIFQDQDRTKMTFFSVFQTCLLVLKLVTIIKIVFTIITKIDPLIKNQFFDRKRPAFFQITDGNKSDCRKSYSKNYSKKDFSDKYQDKGKIIIKPHVYVTKKITTMIMKILIITIPKKIVKIKMIILILAFFPRKIPQAI